MSYSMFYQYQFIKLENHPYGKDGPIYIPFVEAGSNNLYVGNRRVRSWQLFTFVLENLIFDTSSSMEQKINLDRDYRINQYLDEYTDKHYGYYAALSVGGRSTHSTTFGNFMGIVKQGVKKALTIEELTQFGCSIHLYIDGKVIANLPTIKHIRAEDEFWHWYNKYKEVTKGISAKVTIGFSPIYGDDYSKNRNKLFFPKNRQESSKSKDFALIVLKNEEKIGYLTRFTSKGLKHNRLFAKRAYGKKEALRKAKYYNTNKVFGDITIGVEKLDLT